LKNYTFPNGKSSQNFEVALTVHGTPCMWTYIRLDRCPSIIASARCTAWFSGGHLHGALYSQQRKACKCATPCEHSWTISLPFNIQYEFNANASSVMLCFVLRL